ncbi:hypothetical protein OHB07_34990 [Streptomyces sp. NBC_00111]|uniref:hypothetical protein n=1 Tax=Streptomyces sp. NBC_00111 TaxID=2975655 RepID=UPI0032436800
MHSDDALVGKLTAAIAADDKKQKEKKDEPLRRKPTLVPILPTDTGHGLPGRFNKIVLRVLMRAPTG